MAIPAKTVPPFEPPTFFMTEYCLRNGGLKGLRAMRRALADWHKLPAEQRSSKTIRVRGKFVSRLTWLQERSIQIMKAGDPHYNGLIAA